MGEQLEAIDFVYVDSDVPPGTSIPEWRAHRAVRLAAERQARRARHRRLWRAALRPRTLARAVARRSARRRRTAGRPIVRRATV
jgi:hypothetical protein